MKETNLLDKASALLVEEPALVSMSETRVLAEKMIKAVAAFYNKAEETRFYNRREYIELSSALQNKNHLI
jgi:hypothetical protein